MKVALSYRIRTHLKLFAKILQQKYFDIPAFWAIKKLTLWMNRINTN